LKSADLDEDPDAFPYKLIKVNSKLADTLAECLIKAVESAVGRDSGFRPWVHDIKVDNSGWYVDFEDRAICFYQTTRDCEWGGTVEQTSVCCPNGA